ncbi:helix-turn-helix domain-containing protein [Micromonospora aurantiaca (nom. illeg.)]
MTFSEVPNEAFLALGMRDYWDGYFAGRAALLGLAPAQVMHAAFDNVRVADRPCPLARGQRADRGPGSVRRLWALAVPEEPVARLQAFTTLDATLMSVQVVAVDHREVGAWQS